MKKQVLYIMLFMKKNYCIWHSKLLPWRKHEIRQSAALHSRTQRSFLWQLFLSTGTRCCAFFLLPSATEFLFGRRNPPSPPFFCYTRSSFSVFMRSCRYFTKTASRPSALPVSCSSICSSGMKKDDTGMWAENASMSMLSLTLYLICYTNKVF